MTFTTPVLANLVCGSPARNHDFDFARRKLLDALYDAGNIRTDTFNNYDDCAAIEGGDLLVSYTSQVPVSDEGCAALRRFVERGGRWFAIHASNSVRDNKYLPGILGSRFITHPPYMRYRVEITAPDDPLLDGINTPFELDDELYIIEPADDHLEVLLNTRWGGEAMGKTFQAAFRPLMYRRRLGDGGVLYLALGHCNRPFDKPRPDSPDRPDLRGPWALPVYQELIRRGVDWAAGRRPF
ncbi:MAG: ThuA domain-containing protein [Chloroflexi bacterium]|nr:ThuA domain-containing protein [Chloroflexota bacterium]MBV9599636.1 ThuA domain-containing protein [Chloroflexota bacterium]